MMASKQFEDYYRYSLQAVAQLEHNSFSLGIAVTDYDFDDDWQYAAKLKNPWSIDLGIDYRFYPVARKHFFRPYFGAGLAYGQFSWSYEEPIVDTSTGEEFNDDSLDFANVAALIGFDLNFSRYVKLGVELRQDFTFYSITTNEGFTDDIFENYGSTALGLKYSMVF
jgi:outer membrane protein W